MRDNNFFLYAGPVPPFQPSASPLFTPFAGPPPSRERLRAWALEAGFAEAGAVPLPHLHADRDGARFEEWLQAGRAGTMHYLARTDKRGDLLRKSI